MKIETFVLATHPTFLAENQPHPSHVLNRMAMMAWPACLACLVRRHVRARAHVMSDADVAAHDHLVHVRQYQMI